MRIDKRTPRARFADDVVNLRDMARLAESQIDMALSENRAFEWDKEHDIFSLNFERSWLEMIRFAAKDLATRAESLDARLEEMFPDELGATDGSGTERI